MGISYVEFQGVAKTYKGSEREVIKDFTLSIEKGEFIVIVGPSGSGKSTLLELICGFEDLTNGTIKIDENVINEVEPKNRDVAMVFQNYALFPHLTVKENIEFGMKLRKVGKLERANKVKWAAEILQLDEVLDVKPKKLSGGQRQRVALARAMVREPKLFLMDEPLSNLDSKLRYSTCNEITRLHREINGTTIYVTHDQVEALTMADRIVVLNDGEIQQVDSPREIYKNPKNIFVASFIGKPQINLFEAVRKGNKLKVANSMNFNIEEDLLDIEENKQYILGVRSEHINIVESSEASMRAKIERIEYLGGEVVIYLSNEDQKFTMKTYEIKDFTLGQHIDISFKLSNANIFDKRTKENIRRNI
ncbi:ABC transporter ATP-binding protein [Clostridium sp. LP20]|uniref:ABC transporter ATP-binding protein n=1 Tax=Clostridium sp. LP20 TaxID=3418665 RepID=UPI003EE78104